MNEEPTGKMSDTEGQTNWEQLRSRSDADVRTALLSDEEVVPTDEAFWKNGTMVTPH